jgi:hypothetical protein
MVPPERTKRLESWGLDRYRRTQAHVLASGGNEAHMAGIDFTAQIH